MIILILKFSKIVLLVSIEVLCDLDLWGLDFDGCFYYCNCMNGFLFNIYICEVV